MIVTIDPNLIDELDGKELKMLLHLVREIVLHGNDAPGNEELMKALEFSKGTMTKVRKSLEQKGLMLRRDPRAGRRSDYKITTNRVGALVGAAEGQRRVENPASSPDTSAGLDDWVRMIREDQGFLENAAMRYQMKAPAILQHLQNFKAEKQAVGETEWSGFTDFRKNFFFWLKYQQNGTNKDKKTNSRTLHDNGQVISPDEAAGILDHLSRNG